MIQRFGLQFGHQKPGISLNSQWRSQKTQPIEQGIGHLRQKASEDKKHSQFIVPQCRFGTWRD
jgi:hypothetical protein